MNLSLSETDEILKFMIKLSPGYISMKPERVEKIKAVWSDLHQYDSEHDYTFNDEFTILRKSKKIKFTPRKLSGP